MKKIYFISVFAAILLCSSVRAQVVFSSDFESWTGNVPNGWGGTQTTLEPDSIMQYTASANSGSKACRLINRESTTKKFSTSTFSVEAGITYSISYWLRGSGKIVNVSLFSNVNTVISGLNTTIDTTGWIYYSTRFIANTSSTTAELIFTLRNTTLDKDDIQIDDIVIYKTSSFLDINNISANINSNGSLFNSNINNPSFEVPKGSGKHTIFTNNIWLGGYDESSQLHLAAQKYEQSGYDYWAGPVASNYNDPYYQLNYNRVWKINKSDIDNHIANYASAGYIMPASIADWPGNGNTANGEMLMLAPYFDVNGDDVYEPMGGDYPIIRGDQTVFFMFNDDKGLHTETNGLKIGLEIHGMAYSYNNPNDSALNQTVFVNYEIFNRSTNNYHDMYFGSFIDMDLGAADDDYIGCDSLLNMFYTYNGDAIDGVGQSWAYGGSTPPPPAQGAVFLNHPILKFVYFNNQAGVQGDPTTATAYYNYLIGKWSDGSPMVSGGAGFVGSPGASTTPTNFMFSGKPESVTGWTESSEINPPGDRRGVMSVGSFALNAGDKFCVDLAFPFARDYTGTNLTSVALLRQKAQAVQTFYNNQNFACGMPNIGILDASKPSDLIQVYPNPSTGLFNVVVPNYTSNSKIEVYSTLGNLVYSKQITAEKTILSLENNKGMFFFLVVNENKEIVGRGKLVIE